MWAGRLVGTGVGVMGWRAGKYGQERAGKQGRGKWLGRGWYVVARWANEGIVGWVGVQEVCLVGFRFSFGGGSHVGGYRVGWWAGGVDVNHFLS